MRIVYKRIIICPSLFNLIKPKFIIEQKKRAEGFFFGLVLLRYRN